MSLSSAFANMQSLQELQSQQPTKKRVVEIRKSLIVVKKECDAMRKSLLSPKVEKSKVEAPPTYEVLPDGVMPIIQEVVASADIKLADNTSVKGPEEVPAMLPLLREMTVSISSNEPVREVNIDVSSKTGLREVKKKSENTKRKKTKSQ